MNPNGVWNERNDQWTFPISEVYQIVSTTWSCWRQENRFYFDLNDNDQTIERRLMEKVKNHKFLIFSEAFRTETNELFD